MRFVTVRDLRSRSSEVWRRLAGDREIVLTSNGRPIAILSAVSEETLDESITAIRRARAATAVAALQRRSVEVGTDRLSPGEVDAEVGTVRRSRAARPGHRRNRRQ